MKQDLAPADKMACAACVAYSQPGLSRSGQISTDLPASGDQSVFSTGAFAPCIAVVAVMPASISAWAHFSPSTSTTCAASHPRLVVERARLGRSHLAALGVPRPELLLATGRVVAVDHRDQVAGRRRSSPTWPWPGRVHRRVAPSWPCGMTWRRRCLPKQICRVLKHTRKIGLHIGTQVGRDESEDVTAITGCTIGPQPGLLAIEDNLEAIAGAAKHIADEKFPFALLARREQCGQDRFQSSDEIGSSTTHGSPPTSRAKIVLWQLSSRHR
jgi:hypothetical protein